MYLSIVVFHQQLLVLIIAKFILNFVSFYHPIFKWSADLQFGTTQQMTEA